MDNKTTEVKVVIPGTGLVKFGFWCTMLYLGVKSCRVADIILKKVRKYDEENDWNERKE